MRWAALVVASVSLWAACTTTSSPDAGDASASDLGSDASFPDAADAADDSAGDASPDAGPTDCNLPLLVGADAVVTPADYYAARQRALCNFVVRCGFVHPFSDACDLRHAPTALPPGASFDLARARECLAYLDDQPCVGEHTAGGALGRSCALAITLPGAKPLGDPCADDDECASGLCLGHDCGTCATPAAAGDTCLRDHDCAVGLRCTSRRQCGTVSAVGGPCVNYLDCDVGLACSSSGHCVGGLAAGDACPDGYCAADLFCDSGRCVRAAPGDSCVLGACAPFSVCDDDSGRCVAWAIPGCACVPLSNCATGSCIAGTCHPSPTLGETCSGDGPECSLGSCVGGVCTLPTGATGCSIVEECPPRQSCDETCAAPAALGDTCGRATCAASFYCPSSGVCAACPVP